jgi:hypothetical protein
MSARRPVALLALTLLFGWSGVTAILASTHLEVKDTRSFQPTRKVLHEDEVLLACHVISLSRGRE